MKKEITKELRKETPDNVILNVCMFAICFFASLWVMFTKGFIDGLLFFICITPVFMSVTLVFSFFCWFCKDSIWIPKLPKK